MTKVGIAISELSGREAGVALSESVLEQLAGRSPDALIVFASPDQDHEALLSALAEGCRPGALVGCSSAGEFTSDDQGTGLTCVVGLSAPEMRFTALMGRGLGENCAAAANQIASGFWGLQTTGYRHHTALVLADALAGFGNELVDRLSLSTGGVYRFFGGGAGDDARFQRTVVFCGTEVSSDAAVVLEMLSNRPIGIGVQHGWVPGGDRMRVTAAEGSTLKSLDARPAVEVFEAHAEQTGQHFDQEKPIPFFLHNVLGFESEQGYWLRMPLAIGENGSLDCAAEVPHGAAARIMSATPESAAAAAAAATRDALSQIDGHQPAVALVFDCVATRLRLGSAFGAELDAVQKELGDVPFAGFNTYGQVAQAEGQFNGCHNCTAVVCMIPV